MQACRINHAVTGSAFPCLEVNEADGGRRGYALLRAPSGEPDLILTPTRKVSGIEDPSLAAADAPNYFDMAWRARTNLEGAGPPLARDDVGLAVNSELSRTQDQMHIHIGCLSSEAKRKIAAVAPGLSESRWRRLGGRIKGMEFWARAVADDTLAGANPFRLAKSLPVGDGDSGAVTIVAAGTRVGPGQGGFVLLASVNDRLHIDEARAGSDLLEGSCP